jgi:hypothetical protein
MINDIYIFYIYILIIYYIMQLYIRVWLASWPAREPPSSRAEIVSLAREMDEPSRVRLVSSPSDTSHLQAELAVLELTAGSTYRIW